MNESLTLRDNIAIAIITGIFSRESQTKMDIADKIAISDFIWNTTDIILERRDIKKAAMEG